MSDRTFRPKNALVAAVAIAAGIGLGVGVLYGIGGFRSNAAEVKCQSAVDTAKRIEPLVKGQVAALVPAERPLDVSALAFTRADGTPATIADWRGRTVLLNLWATWCVPCRLEMPALDRLQAELGSKDFEVVAVNLDTKDPEKPKSFLSDIKVAALGYYADPTLGLFKALQRQGKSRGMPTTMLIDAAGCELGTMNGPAEWDHPDAKAVLKAVMGG